MKDGNLNQREIITLRNAETILRNWLDWQESDLAVLDNTTWQAETAADALRYLLGLWDD